jgi:DNA-3-methyladenine glycosylase II
MTRENVPAEPPRLVEGRAVAHLRSADPVLARVIEAVGPLDRRAEPDLWRSLVGSIISQQVSTRAAATITARFAALAGDGFTGPTFVVAAEDEVLRACGLSRAKARAVRDLAERWIDGRLPWRALPDMHDDKVVETLCAVVGIGRWTAEMVLIFSLARPDVLPVGDLGFREAVRRAYGLAERPDPSALAPLAEPWRPFRSAATLYLWRSLAVPG